MPNKTKHDLFRLRRGYWPPGLYQDEHGYAFDGKVDAEIFSAATASLGRNEAPALLFDLYYGNSLDLAAHPSVVADAWSSAEYPERCFEPDIWIWVNFFRAAGYTHSGQPATPPTEPIMVYRGCTPEGRRGMAWTSDLAMARRFAHDGLRGRAVGHVYAFNAPPESLLAYIHETGREESEYVVDPAFLKDAVRVPGQ